ncbi:MAG: hypothetical protein CMH63_00170 [Nanoarchaeota archaeon]|jgi:hypothetical protein|nr:hypothetical protein [Nanoarchaeota archaeon]
MLRAEILGESELKANLYNHLEKTRLIYPRETPERVALEESLTVIGIKSTFRDPVLYYMALTDLLSSIIHSPPTNPSTLKRKFEEVTL